MTIKKSQRAFVPDVIVSREPCHACGLTMRFELDPGLNGNHVIKCPNCGHEHCRVIKNGEVTGDRWDSRNGMTFYITATSGTSATGSTTSFSMSWGSIASNSTGY